MPRQAVVVTQKSTVLRQTEVPVRVSGLALFQQTGKQPREQQDQKVRSNLFVSCCDLIGSLRLRFFNGMAGCQAQLLPWTDQQKLVVPLC
jgi:hypothetical protein